MRIPYGYQIENDGLIICQEKAEVVRVIFDYYKASLMQHFLGVMTVSKTKPCLSQAVWVSWAVTNRPMAQNARTAQRRRPAVQGPGPKKKCVWAFCKERNMIYCWNNIGEVLPP